MTITQKISPCLWFDDQAEEAANFYVGIFKNSRIVSTTRFNPEGFEIHGRQAGSVLTVTFELDGQSFTAMNGGPGFPFSYAISFQVKCATQEEIDYYWENLRAGGDPEAQQCGWLKDRFGVSWQVVPDFLDEMFKDESSGAQRAMHALLGMKKLDIDEIRRAYEGAK